MFLKRVYPWCLCLLYFTGSLGNQINIFLVCLQTTLSFPTKIECSDNLVSDLLVAKEGNKGAICSGDFSEGHV